MKKDGLQRMLDFLGYLNEREIEFKIDQEESDSLAVYFQLIGVRVEVDFDVHGMQYSYFSGREAVEVNESKLRSLINENWRSPAVK